MEKLSDAILARARRQDISGEIFAVFGDWAVTDYGLECLATYYPIHRSRLNENWIEHMAEKDWIEMEDFSRALTWAQDRQNSEIRS